MVGTAAIAVALAVPLLVCGPVQAEEPQWRVNFQKGAVAGESSAVPLTTSDGVVLVAVAGPGADLKNSSVVQAGQPAPAKFTGYDPISRLCFFKTSETYPGVSLDWERKAPVQEGLNVGMGRGNDATPGKLKGRVNRIGAKILPFGLLRIERSGKEPAPGAPVIGPDGKVVGVVFQSDRETNDVYAIPAEAIHRVVSDILKKGRLVRGWLGISLRVENAEPKITKVWPGSPAEGGGLQEGDLIVRIGRTEVKDYAEVADAFFYLCPGESVELTVFREGKTFRFALTPATERPN